MAELKRLHRLGRPLDLAHIQRRDLRLLIETTSIWSWQAALKAAGILDPKPENSRRRGGPWKTTTHTYADKDAVLHEIQRRHRAGEPLSRSAVRIHRQRDQLYVQALHFFNTWNSAILAAGVTPDTPPQSRLRFPSKEQVITEIRRRHQQGLSLLTTTLARSPGRDLGLHHSALHFFHHWKNALNAAGITVPGARNPKRSYPTARSVVKELKRRQNAGLPVTSIGCRNGPHADRRLREEVYHYFKSWNAALSRAQVKAAARPYFRPPSSS